jgi:ectoine hydroxylase-related dioxygenase (phytanoyl-CoA dioxygenase family)
MAVIEAAAFPAVDVHTQDSITEEQARFFKQNGLLLLRNLLSAGELQAMQEATLPLYQRATAGVSDDPDYLYAQHELSGERIPFRIEYLIDKDPTLAARRLLGHPFILRSIERLQGRNFIPTWDSMVFKREGMGKAIPWHRDSDAYGKPDVDDSVAAVNVDFYLDGSDMSNCLWGILGSNLWTAEEAAATCERLNKAPGQFSTDERCVAIPVRPGDVLFHNVLVLHGSAPAQSKLRRVVYYEFRPAEVELAHGPHTEAYIGLKQRVLQSVIRSRQAAEYARGERPYEYRPGGRFAAPPLRAGEEPATYRYVHEEYWRKA